MIGLQTGAGLHIPDCSFSPMSISVGEPSGSWCGRCGRMMITKKSERLQISAFFPRKKIVEQKLDPKKIVQGTTMFTMCVVAPLSTASDRRVPDA
jgi:hypothetical protein